MTSKWMKQLVAAGWSYSRAEYDFPDGSRASAHLLERGDERMILRIDLGGPAKDPHGFGIDLRVELPILEVRDERGVWRRAE